MAESSLEEGNVISRLYKWIVDALDRTLFFGIKLTFPGKYLSPLAFLGVLTFITFVILGLTGALLLLYYEPTLQRAYETVRLIEEDVPYGFMVRNIHYHASNAMVFLALVHLYYQYFSGRFKLKNEIIWVTGVILGTFTVIEAFTGYDLIYNTRAELAISIGVSLANASPVIGPLLQEAILGTGFPDFIIRFYAYHVFIIPLFMVILMFFHFPRGMVMDAPMTATITGAIMITAGIFPVDLGLEFDPTKGVPVEVPEWYLGSLYAFIRTTFDRFVTGGLLPGLLIGTAAIIPFVDRTRKFSWKDRPFFTALGITTIAQGAFTTVWGFYTDPDPLKEILTRLYIDPIALFGAMALTTLLCYVFTYASLSYLKAREALKPKRGRARGRVVGLNVRWTLAILTVLIALEVLLNAMAVAAYTQGFKNLAMFEIGLVLLVFAGVYHVYRYGRQLPQLSAK